ncbi:MAG: hypothetical protein JST00_42675 [Deltaproteobacteria bacterium]|nr:hypothetical protein [Deltaproteobacteria bacterium]
MAPPPTLQQEPPYAYVIEQRPLDRCAPPLCRIRTRAVHGYATETMEDGDVGANVAQGSGVTGEQFFQRGVQLAPGDSFELDLPPATWRSELDTYLSAARGSATYEAAITVSMLPAGGAPQAITTERVRGTSASFVTPKQDDAARFSRYGRHVRMPLPQRERRTLRISIKNEGREPLSVGSPLVMRRVEGRGPKQAIIAAHDAVLFHIAEAFLHGGLGDESADWVKRAVADRGVYFSKGQSCGQGTGDFVVRFFLGDYFAAWGWPGMYGKGFDERLPAVLPGPVARAAEQGMTTVYVGNNFTILPDVGNVGWDLGYQTEIRHHPPLMARFVGQWAEERPNDDLLLVWWTSATHAPYPIGRKGPKPLQPPLPPREINHTQVDGVWRNLLDTSDHLKVAYDALRAAAPHASRVMWIGADHSSAASGKMMRRAFRSPFTVSTGLLHAVGGTSEEMNTPFALVYDDESHAWPRGSRIVNERTSSLITWKAFEAFLGLDLQLPRTSTFQSRFFPEPAGPPVWEDRVLVAIGTSGTVRAVDGDRAYALFEGRPTQREVWRLRSPAEQFALTGAPARLGGMIDEELYDDATDPYEYENLAAKSFETTVRMRREVADWMATYWDDHAHPRHRNKLAFHDTTDVELFAPRPFTALVNETPVTSADARTAHVRTKEVIVLEGSDPVGIIELRGITSPLVLKCSANGLPLDVLTPERPRFNLAVARTNCPLPERSRDVAGPGEVLFSFEPARAAAVGPAPVLPGPGAPRASGNNDDLLSGLKRWGYVRDLDEKKK